MWAEFVTPVLRLMLVSTTFAPVSGCPWPLSSWYSLVRVCHWIFGQPLLHVLASHIDVSCAHQRWPILATWPLHRQSNSEPPWCPSSWFSALFQLSSTCRFIQLAVFSLPSSADKFWTSSSPSSYATLFGRRIIGSWTCRFQNVFIYLQVLEFVGQNKP